MIAEGRGSVTFVYASSDCSGVAHSSGSQIDNYGSLPNSAFYLGGTLYKVEATWDNFTVGSFRSGSGETTLGPCETPSGWGQGLQDYPRISVISSPALPMKLLPKTFKIEKR